MSSSWQPHGQSLPVFSVHGILQARTLEWVGIPFSRGSSPPRDWTQASYIAGRVFTIWATRELNSITQIKLRRQPLILWISWGLGHIYFQRYDKRTIKGHSQHNQSYGSSSSHVWMWELNYNKSWVPKNWCFWTVVLEKTLQSPLDCKEIYPEDTSWRKSVLNIHWKDWCRSWNSNTLATWYEELTHLRRPWCWERLRAGGERDNKGWDGWMASLTQWTRVEVSSGNWRWTGRPGVLQSMGLQKVRHDWATELNWTEGTGNWTKRMSISYVSIH